MVQYPTISVEIKFKREEKSILENLQYRQGVDGDSR